MTREITPQNSEAPRQQYNSGDKVWINGSKPVTIHMPVTDKPGFYYIEGTWIDKRGNKSLGPEYHVNILQPKPKRPS